MRIPSRYRISPDFPPDRRALLQEVVDSADFYVRDPKMLGGDGVDLQPLPTLPTSTIRGQTFFSFSDPAIKVRPDLPDLDARKTLAHELQHIDQGETRPWLFDDYVPSSEDPQKYWFHPTELEARAAGWAEERRADQPLLWKREALARALGSSPDWEMGPKLLDGSRRPGDPFTTPDREWEEVIQAFDDPEQLPLPFTRSQQIRQALRRIGL